jgi:AcrR family transcriptional regulator
MASMTVVRGQPANWRQPIDRELSPILEAARDCFYEVGYHGTSVRDIARCVGLTVPALYYHHANKEAILAALLDQVLDSVIARCQLALDEAGPDPQARFNNLVEALVLYMTQQGKNAAMDAEIRSLAPESRRTYSAKRRVVERLLLSAIEDGQQSGVFAVTAPPDTARALLGMIQAITVWHRPNGRLSPSTVAQRYLDIAQHTVATINSK